jgi:hypothetical protein
VTSPSGKMFVTFSTNYTTTASGWEAFYETDLVKVEENKIIKNLQVFPNPAIDQVTLTWITESFTHTTITISGMTGSALINEEIATGIGNNKHSLDISEIPAGVYILEIVSGTERIRQKLVVRN